MANPTNINPVNINLADIAADLGAALKARGFMLAMAESCTGGLVAEAMTRIAGSSAWFDRGFVTYSNAAKVDMLDVSGSTLEKFGAVSEQTAIEMAVGALKNSASQITGSITGIAGPDGGTLEKPVGMVCFAWAGLEVPVSAGTRFFSGSRETIRQQAAIYMMAELIKRLNSAT
jgi:nicotinamide-nucleotide amidase